MITKRLAWLYAVNRAYSVYWHRSVLFSKRQQFMRDLRRPIDDGPISEKRLVAFPDAFFMMRFEDVEAAEKSLSQPIKWGGADESD